jgi:hypothetical protein
MLEDGQTVNGVKINACWAGEGWDMSCCREALSISGSEGDGEMLSRLPPPQKSTLRHT